MNRGDCTIGTRILSKHDGDWHPGAVKSTINDDGMFWVTIEFEGGYKSWGLRFASELHREKEGVPA